MLAAGLTEALHSLTGVQSAIGNRFYTLKQIIFSILNEKI
jgi:hypothetical protein